LYRLLYQSCLNYRLECLVEWKDRAWLQRQLSDQSKFHCHGRQSGDEYWRILNDWDVIVFVSEYEGTPIAMLEALSLGVIPVYPRLGSGGDRYVNGIRPDLLFDPDDLPQAVQALVSLGRASDQEIATLRARCQASV